ncbi:MAG: TRIC cation channel family protein [Candidatus Nanopelagicales bacterium]|nr:TRIC cation channel family protein [Candidatus Nanopelagicales bacterium]MDZ4250168.1 TRIC cation channel family protein [Candidatus Nanopelagicales bacterium]
MTDTVLAVPSLVTTLSITAGAISGALHARSRRLDITGIALVALCTGIGGGAIRDVILGQDVPFFLVSNALGVAAVGAIAGYFFTRIVSHLNPAIFTVDTLLIGVWVVIGAEKALNEHLSASAAVMLGVITAVGGGVLRDVLCREVPTALMPGQWVAASAIASALAFVGVDTWTGQRTLATVLAIVVASGLRLASAKRGWVTPDAVTASRRIRQWVRLGGGDGGEPSK